MPKLKKTLDPADVTSRTSVSRRSALARIGTLVGGATAVVVSGAAVATASEDGCTDSDGGRNADRAGHGRCRPEQARAASATDSDRGRYADPAGPRPNGRRPAKDGTGLKAESSSGDAKNSKKPKSAA